MKDRNKYQINNDNLFWAVKYFNKWIFVPLPGEAKPWILRALNLMADKKKFNGSLLEASLTKKNRPPHQPQINLLV